MRRLFFLLAFLSSPSWAAFGYFKSATLSEAQSGSADSTDWPLTIGLDGNIQAADADLKTVGNGGYVQNSSGYDIRPYSDNACTSALTYELVFYEATTGKLEMHVKIPTLSSSVDTVIYLCFGDSGISTDGSSNATWNSSFVGVWHFPNGSSLSANDSTSNAYNGTISAATAIAGEIDGASGFVSGNSAKITLGGPFAIPTTGELSMWWRVDSNPSNTSTPLFVIQNVAVGLRLFQIFPYLDGNFYAGWYLAGNDDRVAWAISGVSQTNWYYVILTWTNGGTTELSINGVSKATTSSLDATWDTSGTASVLGNDYGIGYATAGEDELRIANVAHNSSWHTATYNSQIASSNFITWGARSVVGGGPTTPVCPPPFCGILQ